MEVGAIVHAAKQAAKGAGDVMGEATPLSFEARSALGRLGVEASQLEALAARLPVAFTLSGAAEGTVIIAQFTAERRFRIGIATIRNVGGGLADLMTFELKAQTAARALGAKELEL